MTLHQWEAARMQMIMRHSQQRAARHRCTNARPHASTPARNQPRKRRLQHQMEKGAATTHNLLQIVRRAVPSAVLGSSS